MNNTIKFLEKGEFVERVDRTIYVRFPRRIPNDVLRWLIRRCELVIVKESQKGSLVKMDYYMWLSILKYSEIDEDIIEQYKEE